MLEQIQLLEEQYTTPLRDLELRSAEYENNLEPIPELIPLNRFRRGWCKVSCENVNRSFFRVLYKDWYKGRWKNHEMELARCILSASEPYYLIVSPQRWKWNSGKLFDGLGDFLQQSDEEMKSQIDSVFNEGLNSDEIVLAGAVIDYTYEQELLGYSLSYIAVPSYSPEIAASRVERNSKIVLLQRDDFHEKTQHFNITLHYNGIESFKNSIILCGLSKSALLTFGWSMEINAEGVKLLNNKGCIIGRLEYYYGARTDIGNRYSGNQPLLQRWIVKKQELLNDLSSSGCPYELKSVTDYVVSKSNES